jgi:hypothetical protein
MFVKIRTASGSDRAKSKSIPFLVLIKNSEEIECFFRVFYFGMPIVR